MKMKKKSFQKNESVQLFEETKTKSFIMVLIENGIHPINGTYEAIASVFGSSDPSLANTACTPLYLQTNCKRVQWTDLPENWKSAFQKIMADWDESNPKKIKGLMKV
jgi:hypothetical protein